MCQGQGRPCRCGVGVGLYTPWVHTLCDCDSECGLGTLVSRTGVLRQLTARVTVLANCQAGASAVAWPAHRRTSFTTGSHLGSHLDVHTVEADPLDQFRLWFDEEAKKGTVPAEGITMVLATASADGTPSARVMLLKGFDSKGFRFFSHFTSRKGEDLTGNPKAALVVHWPGQFGGRQVRVEGTVVRAPDHVSDDHFHKRPRDARLGVWASDQSAPAGSRAELQGALGSVTTRFAGVEPVPRPPFWGVYLVIPRVIEFWRGDAARLHDRIVYSRASPESPWLVGRVAP